MNRDSLPGMGRRRFVAAETSAMLSVPALVTVPNVPILEVGEDWETSTGTFTWDVGDLQSAIAALDDPSVRTPIIKLGHTDPRFDGQPAIGRLGNLTVGNNEQTLYADYLGVPGWLAACMASAYPRRSIEGWFDYETRTGNKWPFVLTGIALLGEAYPAISTLDDIQAMWGEQPPILVPVEDVPEIAATQETANGTHFVAFKEDDMKWKNRKELTGMDAPVAAAAVRASTSVSDITREFYDTIGAEPGNYWWWVRAVLVEPTELIVDDDEGALYRIPYNITTDGTIVFSEPVTVKIEYVDVAASTGHDPEGRPVRIAARFANAEEAKRPPRDGVPHAASGSTTVPAGQEEPNMQLSEEAIRALGLDPATATEDQVNAAVLEKIRAQTETPPAPEGEGTGGGETQPDVPATAPTGEPATPTGDEAPAGGEGGTTTTPAATPPTQSVVPDGMVLVDASAWQRVQETTTVMAKRIEEDRIKERDDSIAGAVRAGKIEKSRMEFWKTKWEADPEGTKQTLASLQPVLPVQELGHAAGDAGDQPGAGTGEAYPDQWKPAVKAANRSQNGRVRVVND